MVKRFKVLDTVTGQSQNLSAADALAALGLPANPSGVYTPTTSALANLTAVIMSPARWTRVGNVVTVSGKFDYISPLGAVPISFQMDLPVPTTLAAINQLTGSGVQLMSIFQATAYVLGIGPNHAVFQATIDAGGVNSDFVYQFSYEVN